MDKSRPFHLLLLGRRRETERKKEQQLETGICFCHDDCGHMTRSTPENGTLLNEVETKLLYHLTLINQKIVVGCLLI